MSLNNDGDGTPDADDDDLVTATVNNTTDELVLDFQDYTAIGNRTPTTVTVTADDGNGEMVSGQFTVTVTPQFTMQFYLVVLAESDAFLNGPTRGPMTNPSRAEQRCKTQ